MKTIAALIIVASVSISGPCQTVSSTTPQYHRSELKKMIRTAHTSEEFDELSMYFQAKEEEFRKKAEDEKKELDRRLAMPSGSSKYPTAADNARGLFQYYQGKANEFAQRAKTYHLRATNADAPRLHP